MVLPKLKRHLNKKNTLNDHGSIHDPQTPKFKQTEHSVIARYRNFNALKICKNTVFTFVAAPAYHRLSFSHWQPSKPEQLA